MVGNVAVAVVLLAVVALLAEWRRRRRNHFWQVTLAEGLTACSILAVLSAWVGWHVNDTQRQRAAVDTISLHGDGTINAYWESRLPDWWEALGDEVYPTEPLLGQVVRIASRDMPGDHVLQELRHLPAIRELFLGGTPLSDPALLAELKHLPNLQLLDLSRTGISDQNLKPIAACETLVDLDLSHNPISDEGLEHLHRLRHLRFLNLTNVDVSVEGVDALQAALPDVVITDD